MINNQNVALARHAQRKKGFTLTEIAIVLGIIGLILGAIWVAAAGVYNNQRVNHAITAMLQTAQGVRSLYATSSTIGTSGTAADITLSLMQSGVGPSDLADAANGTFDGPFPGGHMAVTATGDNVGFIVGMSNATQANCSAVLVGIGGSSRDPGLWEAAADTNAVPLGTKTTAGTALVGPANNTVTKAALTTSVTPATATATYSGGIGGCTAAAGNTVYAGFTLH